MDKLTVVNIGGFGHTDAVFRDLSGMQEAELMGLAPAYQGEDISKFLKLQPAVGKKVYDDYKHMLKELKPDVAIISTRLDLIPLAQRNRCFQSHPFRSSVQCPVASLTAEDRILR